MGGGGIVGWRMVAAMLGDVGCECESMILGVSEGFRALEDGWIVWMLHGEVVRWRRVSSVACVGNWAEVQPTPDCCSEVGR